MKINFNRLIKSLEDKAKIIYLDNERLKELLNSTIKIIEENKQLKEIVYDIQIMIQLVKDWIKGDYKDLSKNTLILIIIALLYLVMPLDLIPDFLPMGFIDDIAVIAYIMSKLSNEINKYKEWKGLVREDLVHDKDFYLKEEKQNVDNDNYIEL